MGGQRAVDVAILGQARAWKGGGPSVGAGPLERRAAGRAQRGPAIRCPASVNFPAVPSIWVLNKRKETVDTLTQAWAGHADLARG